MVLALYLTSYIICKICAHFGFRLKTSLSVSYDTDINMSANLGDSRDNGHISIPLILFFTEYYSYTLHVSITHSQIMFKSSFIITRACLNDLILFWNEFPLPYEQHIVITTGSASVTDKATEKKNACALKCIRIYMCT